MFTNARQLSAQLVSIGSSLLPLVVFDLRKISTHPCRYLSGCTSLVSRFNRLLGAFKLRNSRELHSVCLLIDHSIRLIRPIGSHLWILHRRHFVAVSFARFMAVLSARLEFAANIRN